jgi:hypothetical protein
MDPNVVEELKRAGLRVEEPGLLRIPFKFDSQHRLQPLDEAVPVLDSEPHKKEVVTVRLKPISQLWTGAAVPPDMSREPPPEYQPFFMLLEWTAADYANVVGKPEPDTEYERLYRQLRRRPDGQDSHPLFSYLRAAARLYLSLKDVSRAEFEAMAHRLSQSARHFSTHVGSTNYHRLVLSLFLED